MFPDLEFIKTCLNGLRSRIEKVENWVISFVHTNRPNWAQNDPDALDYIKGRTHYEVNGRVVQLPSKFLPSPTSNKVGAIKADSAKTTDIQPVRLGTDGKLYSSGVPIFTTSGTGSAYTANVPEINELVNGMLVVMIPHAASGSTSLTLNINGLGAHQICRFKSSGSSNNYSGSYSNWLYPGVPVLLMYNSGRWFACNFTKPDADDLLGQVYALHGGTGRSSLTKGSYLVGNGTGKVLLKTPSEVLADIGAIPVPATAKVGQTIVVKAVDENGKPTEWEVADIPSEWEIINEITTAEEVSGITISTDLNGNAYELEEIKAVLTGSGFDASKAWYAYPNNTAKMALMFMFPAKPILVYHYKSGNGAAYINMYQYGYELYAENCRCRVEPADDVGKFVAQPISQFRLANFTGGVIPANTHVLVLGRRAKI